LFECGTQISAIELGVDKNINTKKLQKEIEKIAGEGFHVKNKYQQHDLINKTMKSEKWFTYLILVFILIIASFSILSSLSMLIIDKSGDIKILQSMGAPQKTIRRIFLFEGWLISAAGAIIGSAVGIFICWLQIKFGLITLPGNGSFVVTSYPVEIVVTDIFFIIGVVLFIGFLASWYPVKFISKQNLMENNI
jgi:lipoprotein-releasing system permease protein